MNEELNLEDFRIPAPALEKCTNCGKREGYTGTSEDDDHDDPYFCRTCKRHYPDSLLKAIYDPFYYALKLRTGEVWYFTQARIEGDYVHLNFDEHPRSKENPLPHMFDRGVDVRVSDIVWCADAPDGS